MHNTFNYVVQAENIAKESPVWSLYNKEKLKVAKEVVLTNGFDTMIKLTNEGKMWKVLYLFVFFLIK
jgi:hypothetical protein